MIIDITQIGQIFVGLVALEHFYFLYLEMFLWTTPKGRNAFGITRHEAEMSKTLAASQGLYNGFLAAGLIWGLVYPITVIGLHIQMFFLTCIMIAGVYGGITAKRSILLIQGLPAFIALAGVIIIFLH